MKAVTQAGYGGREQLSVRDMPRPEAEPGCVLVSSQSPSTLGTTTCSRVGHISCALLLNGATFRAWIFPAWSRLLGRV